jgi:hypothetical protein
VLVAVTAVVALRRPLRMVVFGKHTGWLWVIWTGRRRAVEEDPVWRMGTRPGLLECWQVRRTLQAFLDGEVASAHAEWVAAHLESCVRCGIEAATVERVIAALRALRPDLDLVAYTRLTDVVETLVSENPGPDRDDQA